MLPEEDLIRVWDTATHYVPDLIAQLATFLREAGVETD